MTLYKNSVEFWHFFEDMIPVAGNITPEPEFVNV
jgi:hypothetical protein